MKESRDEGEQGCRRAGMKLSRDDVVGRTSPTYFWTSSEPMTRMKQASVRFATALAQRVLPVPGGPYSSTPLGGSMPSVTNFSGYNKVKTTTEIGRASCRERV